jgi:transposase
LIEEARSSGVSSVIRKYGVSASQLFRWRRLADEGALDAVSADEEVVPVSEMKQLQNQVRELQRFFSAIQRFSLQRPEGEISWATSTDLPRC